MLVDKLRSYRELRRRGAPAWPVLFWLHSTARETHLHRRLAEAQPAVPVATAARDRLHGLGPAEAVWQLMGAAGPLLRLAELPMPGPVDLEAFDVAARPRSGARP